MVSAKEEKKKKIKVRKERLKKNADKQKVVLNWQSRPHWEIEIWVTMWRRSGSSHSDTLEESFLDWENKWTDLDHKVGKRLVWVPMWLEKSEASQKMKSENQKEIAQGGWSG